MRTAAVLFATPRVRFGMNGLRPNMPMRRHRTQVPDDTRVPGLIVPVLLLTAVGGTTQAQLDWLRAGGTFVGHLAAIGVASLVSGIVAGAVALAVARLGGYSWAPPRALASRLFRMPAERVGTGLAALVHFVLAVGGLVAVGFVFIEGSALLAVVGAPGLPMLASGPVVVGALLLVGGIVAWVVVANRWLPDVAKAADLSVGELRRQAATVGLVYAATAIVVYPLVLFVAMMLVFFR